ncbi:hypothetical protein EVAR_49037_1 [Eumeta japonica]|uniref:Uncharacterized protein n=1 Tax=Eumeta variegata TaxID=151549 RepID=A0A4C1XSS5_EUMVA|nr:hypothetical protein EVAR_49037_1 [Eumeta japonica]
MSLLIKSDQATRSISTLSPLLRTLSLSRRSLQSLSSRPKKLNFSAPQSEKKGRGRPLQSCYRNLTQQQLQQLIKNLPRDFHSQSAKQNQSRNLVSPKVSKLPGRPHATAGPREGCPKCGTKFYNLISTPCIWDTLLVSATLGERICTYQTTATAEYPYRVLDRCLRVSSSKYSAINTRSRTEYGLAIT